MTDNLVACRLASSLPAGSPRRVAPGGQPQNKCLPNHRKRETIYRQQFSEFSPVKSCCEFLIMESGLAQICTMTRSKISKEETLSFLLTCLVVEHSIELRVDELTLFNLTRLADEAATQINTTEGSIPHEVIETFARDFLESQ